MTYTNFLITFAFSAFLILFFQLISFQLDYRVFALSTSFERQEITDVDADWIFWPPDSAEDTIPFQDNTLQSIPIAKNETDCRLDLEFSPQIKSISYMSNGNIINSTVWLSSNLIESLLERNRINIDNFKEDHIPPLWKKIKFTMAIDINSIFNQGTDYIIELVNERINSTSSKWAEIIYEISTNGEAKEVSKKFLDKFPYLDKNFVEFSIDLEKISNPKDYKILFYITDLYVKSGKLCRMVDSTNWILSPPPNFNLLLSDNPKNMNPGEESNIFVTIEGNTGLQAEAELYVNRTDPSVSFSFPISNKAKISSLTNGSATLHLNVSNSYSGTSKQLIFPIIANISFDPTITNKGGDTFNNTQTVFFSETADLTVNIKKSLTAFERLELYLSILARILRPVGESWQTLALIVVGITSLIYFTRRRKDKKYQNKLNDYQNELNLYKDDKLDKNNISKLDRLRENIISAYTGGDLTKDQYDILTKNISIRYNEIFQNEINLLKNIYNNDEKIKISAKIQSDLDDAYLKEKIDKEHYNLLKEKISKI